MSESEALKPLGDMSRAEFYKTLTNLPRPEGPGHYSWNRVDVDNAVFFVGGQPYQLLPLEKGESEWHDCPCGAVVTLPPPPVGYVRKDGPVLCPKCKGSAPGV